MQIKNILDTSDLAKKTDLNAKITEIEGKIPSTTGLATNSALTAVENKIPDVSSLVKKTDYNTKISEITTPEFNNLAARVFNARLAQANLVTKTDFDTKLQSLNKKINSNKTKHLLVENELEKVEKIDAAYFRGKNVFNGDGTQNYQLVYKYFQIIGSTENIAELESKGLSNEKISSTTTSNNNNNNFATILIHCNARLRVKLNGDFLKQDKVTHNHGAIVNIYIVYRLTPAVKDSNVTLENCLFGAVKLTKNADIDKWKRRIKFFTSKWRIWQKSYYFWS